MGNIYIIFYGFFSDTECSSAAIGFKLTEQFSYISAQFPYNSVSYSSVPLSQKHLKTLPHRSPKKLFETANMRLGRYCRKVVQTVCAGVSYLLLAQKHLTFIVQVPSPCLHLMNNLWSLVWTLSLTFEMTHPFSSILFRCFQHAASLPSLKATLSL